MSWTSFHRAFYSLALRLTLLYSGLCLASMLSVMLVSYLLLRGFLQNHLDKDLAAEVMEYGALFQTQSLQNLQEILDQEVASEGTDRMFFRIFDHAGVLKLSTNVESWPGLDMHRAALQRARDGALAFEYVSQGDLAHPTRVVYGPAGDNATFQIGLSTAENGEILARFEQVFSLSAIAFFFCSLIAGNIMARRALSGVNRITQTARSISAGKWTERVPISGFRDEIDQLAMSFNDMVDRVQILIQNLREVSDDIAHDLRTPLTRMRAAAEGVLRGRRESTAENLAEEMLLECEQLLSMINNMLDISQTESGLKAFSAEPIELGLLVASICDFFQPAAEDKGIDLQCVVTDSLEIVGDRVALSRAIAQLVDNAVKYTGASGSISVLCGAEGNRAMISVTDSGSGIPAGERARLFTRFYRGDASRGASGNGLGLSLARAICRAHGGEVEYVNGDGKGSIFRVLLPARTSSAGSLTAAQRPGLS